MLQLDHDDCHTKQRSATAILMQGGDRPVLGARVQHAQVGDAACPSCSVYVSVGALWPMPAWVWRDVRSVLFSFGSSVAHPDCDAHWAALAERTLAMTLLRLCGAGKGLLCWWVFCRLTRARVLLFRMLPVLGL